MTRRTYNLLRLYLSTAFFGIPLISFSAAEYLRFATSYFSHAQKDSSSYVLWIAVVVPIWALIAERSKLTEPETIATFHSGIKAIGKSVLCMMMVVLALLFFYRQAELSRLFVLLGCVFTFLLSLLTLHVFRAILRSRRGPFGVPLRVAILGMDGYETRLGNHLESMPLVPAEVGCIISLDRNTTPHKWPSLDLSRVTDVVDAYRCNEILVTLPPNRLGELQTVLHSVKDLCIPVRVVLDIGEGVFAPERIFMFSGLRLLDVRSYAVDTMGYTIGKRIFDILFSVAVLLITSPLVALIAIAIKWTSPGPAFFSQERISLNGNRFKMLKFRTMCMQDPKCCSSQHTCRNDPRITFVGRMLRTTSLDELPQFLNVLKGEMSVVGPRPELTFFVQKFRNEIPSYMARHNVKCGITGLAQINGCRGSDTSIPERIKYDLHYIQNWSLLLDLTIIVRTLYSGLHNRNAY